MPGLSAHHRFARCEADATGLLTEPGIIFSRSVVQRWVKPMSISFLKTIGPVAGRKKTARGRYSHPDRRRQVTSDRLPSRPWSRPYRWAHSSRTPGERQGRSAITRFPNQMDSATWCHGRRSICGAPSQWCWVVGDPLRNDRRMGERDKDGLSRRAGLRTAASTAGMAERARCLQETRYRGLFGMPNSRHTSRPGAPGARC